MFNGGDTINNNIVNVEDNSVWFPVDITDNSVWYPNSSWQFIDNLYYDGSTHTCYVDSHDSYVWSTQANAYITNHYSYEIQYHIDYTSITYIGQTAEYDEEYKFYYELPDGRSSADLTAADLEQLSLAFHDVVNYARTADDISQRVLYHFDGDTQDSSYWSYCTSFRVLDGLLPSPSVAGAPLCAAPVLPVRRMGGRLFRLILISFYPLFIAYSTRLSPGLVFQPYCPHW